LFSCARFLNGLPESRNKSSVHNLLSKIDFADSSEQLAFSDFHVLPVVAFLNQVKFRVCKGSPHRSIYIIFF